MQFSLQTKAAAHETLQADFVLQFPLTRFYSYLLNLSYSGILVTVLGHLVRMELTAVEVCVINTFTLVWNKPINTEHQ